MRARSTEPLRALTAAVVVTLAIAIAAGVAFAATAPWRVIVHPDNPLSTVDVEFVRNAYLKKATEWKGGEAIRPITLSGRFPVRDKFTRDVLKKTPAQLRKYWSQQIFSGKAVPPPEASSTADVIRFVLANPGAIGYLPADVDPAGAKVIEVR